MENDFEAGLFADEDEPEQIEAEHGFWKILIVDDDKEVHSVTKMVLDGFAYANKGIQFISAYSGEEAIRLLSENPDTAMMLLDVVMESDDSGLLVVKRIRKELNNLFIRIILRTGQPGQAPEKDVILNYDINGYKAKNELTAQKLFTTVVSSLRSYQDIVRLDQNRKGLEKIVDSASSLFELQSMEKFVAGALTQIISLLGFKADSLFCQASGFFLSDVKDRYVIMAGTGKYEDRGNCSALEIVPPETINIIEKAYKEKESQYTNGCSVVFFRTKNSSDNIVYLENKSELNDWDKKLIELFCKNVSIAFDNIFIYEKMLKNAQP